MIPCIKGIFYVMSLLKLNDVSPYITHVRAKTLLLLFPLISVLSESTTPQPIGVSDRVSSKIVYPESCFCLVTVSTRKTSFVI